MSVIIHVEINQFLQLALLDRLVEHLSNAQVEALLHDLVIDEGSYTDNNCLIRKSMINLTYQLVVSRFNCKIIHLAFLLVVLV